MVMLIVKIYCTAGTFGCLYKGTVRGLFDEQPRKKIDVSIKALRGMEVLFLLVLTHSLLEILPKNPF